MQAPLLLALIASFSVHGLEFIGLGSLAKNFARAAVPNKPFEVEIHIPPPAPDLPPPEIPEPTPAVVTPPPKRVRQKVREEKQPEPEVAKRPAEPEPQPRAPAPEPAGPTVPVEQATTTGCQTGVCLPVGPGAGGPGRVGATGSSQTGSGPRSPAFSKEPVPLYRVQPSYPEDAAENELEGWVLVRFSINKNGGVSTPEVVKSSPPRIFDRAALEAIRSWKYAPQVLDGQAVERAGVMIKLNFKLED